MSKANKEIGDKIVENFDFLLNELNNIARNKGITDVNFEGFILKRKDNALRNCRCGVEVYMNEKGEKEMRCRRCPPGK